MSTDTVLFDDDLPPDWHLRETFDRPFRETLDGPAREPIVRPAPRRHYRQGDVLLLEVDYGQASGAPWERPENGRLVLALGEATGHAHAIEDTPNAGIRGAKGHRWLEVMRRPVDLVHEEHAPITVAPGTYLIRIQREFVAPETPRAGRFGAWSPRPVRDWRAVRD